MLSYLKILSIFLLSLSQALGHRFAVLSDKRAIFRYSSLR